MGADQSKNSAQRKKAGGVLCFEDVLEQFDVTWDLSMMSAESLRELLPDEFHSASH